MNKEQKMHFWIDDDNVKSIPKKPMGRREELIISHKEHGSKLSHSLQAIKKLTEQTEAENSLRDKDIVVFNVELPEKVKIQDRPDIFSFNGMEIRAVQNERNAIVTSTMTQFQRLEDRIEGYTSNGTNKSYFNYVESFEPFIGAIKDSGSLKKEVLQDNPPEIVDIQLMLLPDLDFDFYESALKLLIEKIKKSNGSVPDSIYYLSDKTPVVRAIIPSSTLSLYENDQAIYRIEKTSFFDVDADSTPVSKLEGLTLNTDVNLAILPIVAILDSGVTFPPDFEALIVQHWTASGSKGGNAIHGTSTAGNAVFRYITQNIQDSIITPRARIIDCNILDGGVSTQNFIKRIQEAVAVFSDVTKIFSLSANSDETIAGDKMSIVGYELDNLQIQKRVQFVISSGNHVLWKTQDSLEDILDDDDSRIAPPADSLYSITVGAIAGETHDNSLSVKNNIAPYSRKGPGFKGLVKPDICAYAGTITNSGIVPVDNFSLSLTHEGMLAPYAGTSLSAPIIAGDLAELLSIIPDGNPLIAKALLYHTAIPLWDEDEVDDSDRAFLHNLYGRGLSNIESGKYSSKSKVTFIRTGELNRTTKERVTIYMPETLAAQAGRNVAKVTITCISAPPVDINKGTEYLGAWIRTSLHKNDGEGIDDKGVRSKFKESREKWDICQYVYKPFTTFHAGDWQVWLELFGRWDMREADVPYALIVTIEDVSGTQDIYSEIEALNRYRPINEIRLRSRAKN
jgi:hypothetical protein